MSIDDHSCNIHLGRLAVTLITAVISGCSWLGIDQEDVDTSNYPTQELRNRETIWGEGGFNLFGDDSETPPKGGEIGVNSFLWRATLDTISFMPLTTADPFGGVVITDWYQPPESPTERFKINVFILGRELRGDGIRTTVFRQRLHPSGTWIDAPVSPATAPDLENTILSRARELRVRIQRNPG